MKIRLKVCGVTAADELVLLNRLHVSFAGIWHGVDGGHADLPISRVCDLVREAHAATNVEPVLVTFLKEPGRLRDVIAKSGVGWVQLHGFQSPSLIPALRTIAGRRIRIIKVLHMLGRRCLEQGLIDAYERAGVDVFLFDAAMADGRIGSTGQRLDRDVIAAVADRLNRPFLLAGGISADSVADHGATVRHPGFLGIDVDTAARGPDGRLSRSRIEELSRSWGALTEGEGCHAAELH